MFNIFKKTIDFGNNKTISIETGFLAKQAQGSILVKYGNTTILCTVCYAPEDSKDTDFFPMSVNYIEKAYSVGKIPGGFLKREAKQSEREILISRVIDRSIRPMFKDGFYRQVSVICTLLSYDANFEPEIPAVIAAMTAVKASGLPLKNIIGCARVGMIDGQIVLNPSQKELRNSKLDLVVSGTKSSVVMVESIANFMSEEDLIEAVWKGQEQCSKIVTAIEEFCEMINAKEIAFDALTIDTELETIKEFKSDLEKAYEIKHKLSRYNEIDKIKEKIKEKVKTVTDSAKNETPVSINNVALKFAFDKLSEEVVRHNIIEKSQRIDGRQMNEIRVLDTQATVLPMVHGSSIFTRGQTQVMSVATVGGTTDEKTSESVTDSQSKERFLLDYNFHGFSCGSAAPQRAPGRREIGHGRLAYKALLPILPDKASFPHTIRVVAEVLESDGSTSMATVCSASMALMDAAIPTKGQVGGIAMGLVKEGEKYKILTDIMADEDHLGDMDFKVAGTVNGVTALQMDLKIDGISKEIMKEALDDAKNARLRIISKMDSTIDKPKEGSSSRGEAMKIPVDRIADLIGKGGCNIKKLSEDNSVKIDVSREGDVTVSGSQDDVKKAIIDINALMAKPSQRSAGHSHPSSTNPSQHNTPDRSQPSNSKFEVGKFYQAKVVAITTSGIDVVCNTVKSKIQLQHIIGFDGDMGFVTSKIAEGAEVGVRCNDIINDVPVFSTKLDFFSRERSDQYRDRKRYDNKKGGKFEKKAPKKKSFFDFFKRTKK